MSKTISLITLNDYLTTRSVTGASGNDLVYTEGEPSQGQFTYNESYKGVKVNCDRGYFRIFLGRLKVGDTVNIKCYVYNQEGNKVHASLDIGKTSYGGDLGSSGLMTSRKSQEWEFINITTTVFVDGHGSVVIGLSGGERGIYLLKDVKITVDSVYNNIYNNLPFKNILATQIKKVNGEYGYNTVAKFRRNITTLRQLDEYTLVVKFEDLEVLNGLDYYCLGWGNVEDIKYRGIFWSISKSEVALNIYSTSSLAKLKLNEVEDGTNIVMFATV